MNYCNDIEQLLDGNKAPEQQWIDEITRQHPYFTLPILLKVKHNGGQDDLQKLALMSPDRRDLAIVIGKSPAAFGSFYPQKAQTVSDNETAIDNFLNNYGSNSSKEIDAINKAIFNPTPDYADILAAQSGDESGKPLDKEDELISSFIAKSRERERETMTQSKQITPHVKPLDVNNTALDNIDESSQNDGSMLSESLAKMYIARHKYSKALEIIESINLNFPEKSIYFADQIRFLRKILLNEETKNKL